MSASAWILLAGFILIVVIYVSVYRRNGPVRLLPNLWVDPPEDAGAGFVIYAACSKPWNGVMTGYRLMGRGPVSAELSTGEEREIACVAVARAGEQAGMVVDPGRYWIYALPVETIPPNPTAMLSSLAAAGRDARERIRAVAESGIEVTDSAAPSSEGVWVGKLTLGLPATRFLTCKAAPTAMDGTLVEILPGARYRVQLADSREVIAHLPPRAHLSREMHPGDRVRVEVSAYDPHRGRLSYHYRQ